MTELNNVISGLKRYLEAELICRVSGYQKWLLGVGVSMALDNGVNIFNELKNNSLIKALGIVNEYDEIDIEKIYKYVMEQAQKSAITFQVPIIGAVTLKAEDVEKLYAYIR